MELIESISRSRRWKHFSQKSHVEIIVGTIIARSFFIAGVGFTVGRKSRKFGLRSQNAEETGPNGKPNELVLR